ncbi:aldehyde dehydrogenase family protein [Collimonas arenae]|uniref:2,5-dioxovalerate dehydrogenase n=1 Tax=Collimonas arenae TaxID=279058 RepID=A0A127PT63_9BURK|nr:aldehyde dehydrogenase (NADP(+)) [Collimonas arenae]AMP00973.1 aldehyde dehydrogenase family protein [Collimonas arenae]AMP10864.1 aldehyde dehydrogenase family protein [Collimonas arenae]
MNITGESLIGASSIKGGGADFFAFDPSTAKDIEPAFHTAGKAEIDCACDLARIAFDPYRATSQEERARFLETIAQNILDLGDQLIERAMSESGLPKARLEGERGRTVGQLKLFAEVLREGSWQEARIDPALPERQPLPRVDLRLRMIALGPVAVFGASNFPLAFSVAGGDTAAALAAGCPVVVKAHPAHPGTSELVGRAIQKAVATAGLPEGVFSLLTGIGNELGTELVRHPAIQAVGFTGSRHGGLALMAVAAARPQPIPVYAEMSSINPVFLLPHALAERAEALASGFVDSLVLGVGQFCTNPGLVLGLAGPDLERFQSAAADQLAQRNAATMLTAGIHQAYQKGVGRLAANTKVHQLSQGVAADAGCKGVPTLFATSARDFLNDPQLSEEVFGPASLLISCRDVAEMREVAEHLEGQLTATLQMADGDHGTVRDLLPILERKVGRILANGFPTGVEVSYSMVHGGPFPATSDSRVTSVGATSIERFLRPVSYQNLPQDLLPAALQDDNPLGIWQRINGQLSYR